MKKIKTTVAAVLAATMVLSSSIVAFAGQWQQEGTAWKYQNDDNTYTANGWQWIDGKRYYFDANGYMAANKWIGNYYVGSNGAMLTNTTTPDGYQVGADGAWIKSENDGVHTKRASDPSITSLNITVGSKTDDQIEGIYYNGEYCGLMDKGDMTIIFPSVGNYIDPINHELWVVAYSFYNGQPFAIGEPKVYSFEYDTPYSLDYTGTHTSADSFYNYCKQNNLMIEVSIVDPTAFGNALETGIGNSKAVYLIYR